MTTPRHHWAASARHSGFTLIELLIVIVILGVLATIVIFGTGTFTDDSKTGACKANAKIMNIAEASYAAQHPGLSAGGNSALLAPYIRDPVPTSGTGAVAYDSGAKQWTCA